MKFTSCCLFFAGIAMFTAETQGQANYCNRKLCPCGVSHIGCNNKEKLSEECTVSAKVVPLTTPLGNAILGELNTLRNQAASGTLRIDGTTTLPGAGRMATLRWDCDLAALATASIYRCSTTPDRCRSTTTYPYSGQLTQLISYNPCRGEIPDVLTTVVTQIRQWFKYYSNVNRDVIESYEVASSPNVAYGTFTMLVQERNTHVGCSMLRQKKLGYTQQLLICNFAYGNRIGKPVYTTHTSPGSLCSKRSKTYRNLCDTPEVYNVKA